jgi:putative ABC transport system permease protein
MAFARLASLLRNLFHKQREERELDTEVRSHELLLADEKTRAGMSPKEAHRAARIELGGIEQVKEQVREIRAGHVLETLFQDVRFGLRMLRKNPGFTVVAVLTLALGIGANTAIFSVFYGVLLSPLPYPKPEQIVQLWEVNEKTGNRMSFADPNFEDVRAQSHSFQGLAEYSSGPQAVSNDRVSTRAMTSAVSRDFFSVMGVQPIQGRGFAPEEQQLNGPTVALISYSYWKQSLGGSSDLSSIRLKIGRQSASVVGVLPPGFRFPDNTDIWVPRELYVRYPARTAHNWHVVGRLREGLSIKESRLELSSIARRLKQQYGQETITTDIAMEPLRKAMTGNVRVELTVLLGASIFLLLIACANVVNLMLAQAAARERELALRAALGASRGRLVRQFLTEALLLSAIGGTLGVLAALWGLDALLGIAPSGLPRLEDVSINLPVLLFSFGVVVLIASGLGIICAWRSAAGGPADALNEGGRFQGSMPHKQMLVRLMIAGQLITAMMLLVGAGLMGRSLLRVFSVDPGFKTEKVLTMELDLPDEHNMARRTQLLDEMFARLRHIPGVEDLGGTTVLPLLAGDGPDGAFVVMNPGQISPRMQELTRRAVEGSLDNDPALLREFSKFFEDLFRDRTPLGEADYQVVSEGFFKTLGIPLLRGRLFDDGDAPEAQHVAVISESLARAQWPNQDALGQTIEFGNMDGDLRLLSIIGVVGDVHDNALEAPPRPTVYVNYRQRPRAASHFNFVLRASGKPTAVFSASRKIVRSLDPDLSPRFNTLSQIYSASLENRRFSLTLVAIFSAIALLLAMAGIYGVNAYSVAQRTREIGVRMALGASAREIMSMILRQGISTAAIGVAVGTLGSLALARWIRSLLFEVGPADPITFFSVALLLIFAVLVACWIPARYASHVDPMVALRYE